MQPQDETNQGDKELSWQHLRTPEDLGVMRCWELGADRSGLFNAKSGSVSGIDRRESECGAEDNGVNPPAGLALSVQMAGEESQRKT